MRVHLYPQLLTQLLAILKVVGTRAEIADLELLLKHFDVLHRDEVLTKLVLLIFVNLVWASRLMLRKLLGSAACGRVGTRHCTARQPVTQENATKRR